MPAKKFGGAPRCGKCNKFVYPNEQVVIHDIPIHRIPCFRCDVCEEKLDVNTCGYMDGKTLCKEHFKEEFKAKLAGGGNNDGLRVAGGVPVKCDKCESPSVGKFCTSCNSPLKGGKARGSSAGMSPAKGASDEGVGQAKLEDSNVAGLGGDEDRKVKKGAAETEKEWDGAGQKPGLEVWRVENHKAKAVGKRAYFGVKRVHDDDKGKFFDGDSYIVLHTRYKVDENGEETDALEWDVHFWLGEESTQDEMGVAAYKTVELDTLLDDGPVQHRQVQGYETDDFLALWDPAMIIEHGGIEGGFSKVEDAVYEPRLLRINRHGKLVRVIEVPKKVESLCHDDCFVLDMGKKLLPFVGRLCNNFEQAKMRTFIRQCTDERNGRAEVAEDNSEEFYSFFGVDPTVELPDDVPIHAPLLHDRCQLWRLSLDGDHEDGFTKIADGPLSKDMLDSDDAFVVDAGDHIYAWVGAHANPEERKQIMVQAMDYLVKEGRPPATPITRVWEGQVVAGFEQCFEK